MPFDWLRSEVPAEIAAAGATRFRAQQAAEIRTRAALLRRLGYDRAYAEQRALGNLAWAYEGAGKSPFTKAEVKALVAEIYK